MTQKTKTQLDSAFADNNTGLITPAGLRDLVETAAQSRGSVYTSGSAPTAIPVPGTFYKAAGSTTPGGLYRFTAPVDNRLTYGGAASTHAHLSANISVVADDDAQVLRFGIAKNGVVLPHSIIEHKLAVGADTQTLAVHADTSLVAGDYLEIWCTNVTSSAPVTVERSYMGVVSLLSEV